MSPRGFAIGLLDERGHLRPVGPPVDAYTDPAARTHVRRTEEPLRVQEDERLLLAERRGQPHSEMIGAVVMIVGLSEQLALHPPPGFAPLDLLHRGGLAQA